METLMSPMPTTAGPELGARARGGRAGEDSFAGHLESRLVERRRSENALGASRDAARAVERQRNKASRGGGDGAEKDRKAASGRKTELTALVGEYLGLIREQARDVKNGPGTWQVAIDDPSQLAALAASAGMNQTDTTALLESFEQNQGVFEMSEFLVRLSRHFLALENEAPVLVPETDLPYLQLILSQLGLPSAEVERLGEQAVRGDQTLDLAAFLQGLENLELDGVTTLTGWDAEQLLVVLDAAGVSRALQQELLPELHAPWEQPQRPNLPLELDLARLRELLAKGVAEIRNGQPKADIPEFLAQLKEIFSRAGFAEQKVGWSPAVQGAVEKIYGQLLESVDLATVRIQRPEPAVTLKEELRLEEKFAQPGKDAVGDGRMIDRAVAEAGSAADGESKGDEESFSGRHFLNELREHGRGNETVQVAAEPGAADNHRTEALRALTGAPRFNSQLEQQIFNRISSGVSAGLQRNEHHLVMHLYPRELGEVRVEMLIRDNQVSLSFAMESSKVKEVLERHMDLFRESLERRGFVLGECMVSVDQQGRDESSEAWQRFTSAWTNQRGSGMVRRENLAEVPESVLYHRPNGSGREQGIDLFA